MNFVELTPDQLKEFSCIVAPWATESPLFVDWKDDFVKWDSTKVTIILHRLGVAVLRNEEMDETTFYDFFINLKNQDEAKEVFLSGLDYYGNRLLDYIIDKSNNRGYI